MTLMAGPIDTRVNPTKVNELANSKPIDWFEQNLIARVPFRYDGAFRRVYPGFVQLAAFMSMNIERHVKAHRELYEQPQPTASWRRPRSPRISTTNISPCSISPPSSIWRRCGSCSRSTRLPTRHARLARRARSSRARSGAPCCSRSRARRDDICAVGQTAGRARPVLGPAPLSQAPPHAGRRRPLRRVLRQALGEPDLPAGEERHPVERVGVAAPRLLQLPASDAPYRAPEYTPMFDFTVSRLRHVTNRPPAWTRRRRADDDAICSTPIPTP